MAQAKTARIVEARQAGGARVLTLESAEPLGFVGGQYLIVNSGIVLPSGKLAKRAYSIWSRDDEQARVQLAVAQVGGPGSEWLRARAVGDVIEFSGPWGKLLPDDARPRPTLVVATDTGITAALGLVRGRGFAPQRPHARLVWMVAAHNDLVARDNQFLPLELVREAAGLPVDVVELPPVGHPERAAAATAALAGAAAESVFLAGDGAVLHPLRAALGGEARLECFFNNPEKKST